MLHDLRRREDGSVIVFGMLITVMVLFFAGLAVDLMRTESARAKLQGALDRGILAAADVDQKADRVQVVKDYMASMGLAKWLVGEPTYIDGTVTAQARMDVNAIFANFTDTFQVAVSGAATNKIPDAEVALVLDISGSMERAAVDEYGMATGKTRLEELQRAADSFLDSVLTEATADHTSVSIVPFSTAVAVGKPIFDQLTTDKLHDYAYCIEFDEEDFRSTTISLTKRYKQMQYALMWNFGSAYPLRRTTCSNRPYEQITLHSQNRQALKAAINMMEPRTQTAIHYGMKWGVAALDPSSRPITNALNAQGMVPDIFKNRPLNYGSRSLKAIVLLTDGENTGTYRIKDKYYDGSHSYADTSAEPTIERERVCYITAFGWRRCYWEEDYVYPEVVMNADLWAHTSFGYWYDNTGSALRGYEQDDQRYVPTTAFQADQRMKLICDAAKARGIVIYGVGVSLQASGRAPMRDCVSSPSHYFDVRGGEINEAFQAIAEDFVSLRLSQ